MMAPIPSKDAIISYKTRNLAKRRTATPIDALRAMASMQSRPLPFLTTTGQDTAIIGQIRYEAPDTDEEEAGYNLIYDPVLLATRFIELGGVDAISVFTDSALEHDGTLDLTLISDAVTARHLPVINQDFVTEEYHIVQARAAGASVVTLNAELLPRHTLRLLVSAVSRNRMVSVVDVYTQEQLEHVVAISPNVIGLSSRMLEETRVDLQHVAALRNTIHENLFVVITQPLDSFQAVEFALRLNLDGITLDETLLTNPASIQRIQQLRKGT